MPPPPVFTISIVLKVDELGEKFKQIQILSPEFGVARLLQRRRSKSMAYAPDLFDQGEAQMELKPDNESGFLQDFVLEKKRPGIAKNYRALESAARISLLVLSNPVHEDNGPSLFELVSKSLDALDQGRCPDATLLKTYFVYARQEGYPVAEDWIQRLSESERRRVVASLNAPLTDTSAQPSKLAHSLHSLASYLSVHTHIHLE